MEKDNITAKSSKRKSRYFYLLSVGTVLIAFVFLVYQLLVGQAFADRGLAKNSVPIFFSPHDSFKASLLESTNEYFKCSNNRTVDISHFNSVGMFPYLIKNGPGQCNKAADFVGYDNFISAMLHGERHFGIPAKAYKPSSTNHHPGLEELNRLLAGKEKYDRSVEFYWWMFPIPMGIPNRGFAYAIFQGDIKGLQKAAKVRNLTFEHLILDSLKVFMALQGWDIEASIPFKASKYSYDERDHVITKAWISLKCFSEYPEMIDSKIIQYKESLETFMAKYLIRYPADYSCIAE